MYCNKCGKLLEPGARFCPSCGTVREASIPSASASRGQLVRSRSRREIAGVCGGLADHYGWDLNLVRILTVVTAIFTGVGLFAYLVAWVIIPDGQYALPFGAPPPPPPAGTTL